MFGQGYTPKENLQLAEGKYSARIIKTEYFTRNGYSGLDVFIEIDGKRGYKPDKITFFDRPVEQQKAEGWDFQMTKFFDAFGIQRGNFNVDTWRGRTGTVEIAPQKSNPKYMVAFPVVEHEVKQQQPQPQASHDPEHFDDDGIPF